MGTGLAIIWHAKSRLLFSVSGIAMAVVIIFVEQGFLYGVLDSQARITRHLNGELVVIHESRTHLNKWNTFKKAHIHRLAAVAGVATVIPIYKTKVRLRNPDTEREKMILAYGFPPSTTPFHGLIDNVARSTLKRRGSVLFDQLSRNIYGTLTLGSDLEINGENHRLEGFFRMGPTIVYDGALLMGDGTLLPHHPGIEPIMAVVQLEQNADLAAIRLTLERAAPQLTVMTPGELEGKEKAFVEQSTPIGILFGIGMVAGLVIGVVVCYQVLFNDINNMLPQYATLKAMGYSNVFLAAVVVEQALFMSVLGFILALPIVWLFFDYLAERTAMLMFIDWQRILRVFVLTLGIGLTAAVLAVRVALRADPARLF
ncbi:ABC exporter transmembrane subunit, DevC protein [Thiorhodovibrio winogradskyi]|uniref:ABC exporter transmembrane subunit, DevC protein n=1 Tax=Thiorhodovibrio winogradskyi TaxID=77007 RepID=A0ABZ0SHF7_9GAMM|nr:ABC transporter permease [Thiorhodovibrio winogradskyi]